MPYWTRTSMEMHIDQSENFVRVSNTISAHICSSIVKNVYGLTTRHVSKHNVRPKTQNQGVCKVNLFRWRGCRSYFRQRCSETQVIQRML